ncbi:MAG: hypothetical protein KAQ92_01710, partial [Candidatus Aenigmarchaeota archaeon]|nr:hypothetical protein [Candidatus Aenigmarchaeota archaeon]
SVKITADNIIKTAKPAYNLTVNLWYIDKLYYRFIDNIFIPVCELTACFDKYIIDGIVNFVGLKKRFESWILSQMQTGQVQTYITILFTGMVGIMLVFLTIHWLSYFGLIGV